MHRYLGHVSNFLGKGKNSNYLENNKIKYYLKRESYFFILIAKLDKKYQISVMFFDEHKYLKIGLTPSMENVEK